MEKEMATTVVKGELEIDHRRGVIYFHTSDAAKIKLYGVTMLRIRQLPTPVPKYQLDITHMKGQNWKQTV